MEVEALVAILRGVSGLGLLVGVFCTTKENSMHPFGVVGVAGESFIGRLLLGRLLPSGGVAGTGIGRFFGEGLGNPFI